MIQAARRGKAGTRDARQIEHQRQVRGRSAREPFARALVVGGRHRGVVREQPLRHPDRVADHRALVRAAGHRIADRPQESLRLAGRRGQRGRIPHRLRAAGEEGHHFVEDGPERRIQGLGKHIYRLEIAAGGALRLEHALDPRLQVRARFDQFALRPRVVDESGLQSSDKGDITGEVPKAEFNLGEGLMAIFECHQFEFTNHSIEPNP